MSRTERQLPKPFAREKFNETRRIIVAPESIK